MERQSVVDSAIFQNQVWKAIKSFSLENHHHQKEIRELRFQLANLKVLARILIELQINLEQDHSALAWVLECKVKVRMLKDLMKWLILVNQKLLKKRHHLVMDLILVQPLNHLWVANIYLKADKDNPEKNYMRRITVLPKQTKVWELQV